MTNSRLCQNWLDNQFQEAKTKYGKLYLSFAYAKSKLAENSLIQQKIFKNLIFWKFFLLSMNLVMYLNSHKLSQSSLENIYKFININKNLLAAKKR